MKGDPTECTTFKNIKLYPGWMVSNEIEEVDDGTRKKKKVIEWVERTPADCLEELAVLCETIANKMESWYTKSITEAAVILGNCLHLPDVCALLQGTADQFTAQQRAALEGYGKADFHIFYNYVCTLRHIMQLADEKPELSLLPELSHLVHRSFKEVVFQIIWKDLGECRGRWFPAVKGIHKQSMLNAFEVQHDEFSLEDKYVFRYDGHVCTTTLNQADAFATFYTNESVYNMAGPEFCIALDVALAMSGSEAVVESCYSVMKTQDMVGGQVNDTLVQRTNVDWSFPMPIQCLEAIKDVALLYLDGDKETGIPRHQPPVFLDERGRTFGKYMHGSKVLDRLSATAPHFHLNEKDRRNSKL